MYTVFNEGWGQYETQRVVTEAKQADPSRLWVPASGWWDPQYANSHNHSHENDMTGYVSHPSLLQCPFGTRLTFSD